MNSTRLSSAVNVARSALDEQAQAGSMDGEPVFASFRRVSDPSSGAAGACLDLPRTARKEPPSWL